MTTQQSAPSTADLDAARLLLARLGVTAADLLAPAAHRAPAPTFAEYIPVVRAAVADGTRRVYGSGTGSCSIGVLGGWMSPRPRRFSNSPNTSKPMSSPGETPAEDAQRQNTSSLRCIYRHAEHDGHITAGANPALKVAKPRRLPSTRRAVPDTRLAEINHIAATTGNDPALDTLILRLHTETACRHGGALALTPADLDPDQCLIRLKEKSESIRWQPVSPTLMGYLQLRAEQRKAPAHG